MPFEALTDGKKGVSLSLCPSRLYPTQSFYGSGHRLDGKRIKGAEASVINGPAAPPSSLQASVAHYANNVALASFLYAVLDFSPSLTLPKPCPSLKCHSAAARDERALRAAKMEAAAQARVKTFQPGKVSVWTAALKETRVNFTHKCAGPVSPRRFPLPQLTFSKAKPKKAAPSAEANGGGAAPEDDVSRPTICPHPQRRSVQPFTFRHIYSHPLFPAPLQSAGFQAFAGAGQSLKKKR